MLNETQHLLIKLGEEGAEISQAVSKALLFGLDDKYDPQMGAGRGTTTREKLIGELNDLLGVADMLVTRKVLPANWQSPTAQVEKMEKTLRYMKYARANRTLK